MVHMIQLNDTKIVFLFAIMEIDNYTKSKALKRQCQHGAPQLHLKHRLQSYFPR